MTSWYSIRIFIPAHEDEKQEDGSLVVASWFSLFDGYFSVSKSNNLITSFYDSVNPSVNIHINNGLRGADSKFVKSPDYSFSGCGVNIKSFPSLNNNASFHNLYNNLSIDSLDASGNILFTTHCNAIFTPITDQLVCFKTDTKILTDKGYVAVQDLKKGDLVKTLLHDFKPISMIGFKRIKHRATPERIINQLYVCKSSKYPEIFEDLVITGCHCILVDTFKNEGEVEKTMKITLKICLTDEKYRLPACVDLRAKVHEPQGIYTIYHFALESDDDYINYGIWANGLLVETCSKYYLQEKSKMKFID